jgi:hypothetical protein
LAALIGGMSGGFAIEQTFKICGWWDWLDGLIVGAQWE